MKAMILGAGMGKRLGKITDTTPKVLVDINGKSVLQLAVEKCSASGFDDIIVNIHHHASLVEKEIDRLNKLGFRLSISDERDGLLETGGGLYHARAFFNSEPFLLYNADIVTDINLADFLSFHKCHTGLATLAVRQRPGNRFFLVNSSGLVKGWCNKATGEEINPGSDSEKLSEIAFTGLHIINPEIFKYMKAGKYTMTDVYLQLASDHDIYTYRYDSGYWGDIGTPENLEKIREMLRIKD